MRDHGIDVIGASTRRLLPGVYATIGFHRRRDGSHGAAVPVKRLDTLARRLQDMTSGLMLRQILDQANGLSTFRSSYFERTQAASAHPRQALSLREREIASLVCEGGSTRRSPISSACRSTRSKTICGGFTPNFRSTTVRRWWRPWPRSEAADVT
jgi:hypothetical protein